MRYKAKHITKKRKWMIAGVVVLGVLSLGTSYAAWANAHSIVHAVNTKNFDFKFFGEYDDDFSIYLDYVDKSEKLDAIIDNSGKSLTVSGMEAVDMDKLISGEASIRIEYRLQASDLEDGLLSAADETYDLGVIPFQLSAENPYWKICNENGSWGIGEPELKLEEIEIPEAVFDLLPESLGELHGYNHVTSSETDIVRGTVTIKQLEPCPVVKPTIDLTSLKLSDELNLKIAANDLESSDLEIMANYNFTIPLALDQANSNYYK